MKKLTTTAAALALALASGAVLADDSSMSRWTGDSYKAFEASRTMASVPRTGAPSGLTAVPDNSMSRWNGDSYTAFEQARTAPSTPTMSIAQANRERAALNREKPAFTARHGRAPVNAFRDDLAG